MSQLREFLRFAMSHKLKYVVFLLAFLFFVPFLFPYSDVGDLVAAQIGKATNNQLFVQFDRLKLALFPSAAVGVENISIESTQFPAISAQEVEVRPSIGALITQKPSGTLIAKGLFRGDVTVDLKPGKKTGEKGDIQTHLIAIRADSLSLAEINKVAELPVLLRGKLKLNTQGLADPTFTEQPDFDIELTVDQLEIPSSTVNTMMGPLNLPELKLSTVEMKGRLSAGRFLIEKGIIGKTGDEMAGTLKGNMALLIQNRGGPAPIMGAYNFDVDLNIKKSFQDKAALFLSFLDSYKTPLVDGARYKFKVNGSSPQAPPNITALQ